ncbi:hypothetical protein LCGC14_2646900, partial [marine sediment metagenome]
MNDVIIVAEIGINHNGDLDLAKQMIDIARVAGIRYVKFQKRNLEECIPMEERSKKRDTPWGYIPYMEYKQHLEFELDEYKEIDSFCKSSGMEWFASPWDPTSAEFLLQFDCPFIKIASACITDFEMFKIIKASKVPVIISTGMSTKKEVDKCIKYFGNQIKYVLACTSTYPTKDGDVNLNFIMTLKKTYSKYKIGFSNHHPGLTFCIVAAALGAEMIEFHMTVDRAMFGSDQAASIETNGVLKIGRDILNLRKALGNGKWTVTSEEEK